MQERLTGAACACAGRLLHPRTFSLPPSSLVFPLTFSWALVRGATTRFRFCLFSLFLLSSSHFFITALLPEDPCWCETASPLIFPLHLLFLVLMLQQQRGSLVSLHCMKRQ